MLVCKIHFSKCYKTRAGFYKILLHLDGSRKSENATIRLTAKKVFDGMENMETNKKYGERLLLGAILAAMVLLAIGFDRHEYEYQRYDTGTLEYVRAEVLEIWEEELTPSGADGEYVKGYQKIMVRI